MHTSSALVVFDLDGTLALNRHRQHFLKPAGGGPPDWPAFFEACDRDEPNWPVIYALRSFLFQGFAVEIWSGRSDAVIQKTKDWLTLYGIGFVPLKMRIGTDYRSDVDLKKSWLDTAPAKPMMVFDDRNCVVDMWRRNGIVCAQVAPGDF